MENKIMNYAGEQFYDYYCLQFNNYDAIVGEYFSPNSQYLAVYFKFCMN